VRRSLQRLHHRRLGYTLIEMIVSLGAASVLMAGLGSAVFLSTQAFDAASTPAARRVSAAEVQQQILNDLRYARTFLERASDRVAFVVPDRTGDGRPDTIAYDWSGGAGSSLTYSLNGSPPAVLAESVENFTLTYKTQTLNAPVIPDEEDSLGTILFVSAGQVVTEKPTLAEKLQGAQAQTFVVATAAESDQIAHFEAAGYTVVRIAAAAADDEVATALTTTDVVYISGEVNASNLSPEFDSTKLGIVSACRQTAIDFGFCTKTEAEDGTSLNVVTNKHYITSEFITGPLKVAGSSIKLLFAAGDDAKDLQSLGEPDGKDVPSLLALNAGAERADAGLAAGRRVQLPFGFESFSPATLTENGWQVIDRAVQWAMGVGDDGVPNVEDATQQTLGYDDIFATSRSSRRTQIGTQASLKTDGFLTGITVYIGGNNAPVRVAIYSDSNGEPASLIAQSAVRDGTRSWSWLSFQFDSIPLSAATYWLAVSYDNGGQAIRTDARDGTKIRIVSNRATHDGFLKNWGDSEGVHDGQAMSIYATVETSK